jgi:hypothetical protein
MTESLTILGSWECAGVFQPPSTSRGSDSGLTGPQKGLNFPRVELIRECRLKAAR